MKQTEEFDWSFQTQDFRNFQQEIIDTIVISPSNSFCVFVSDYREFSMSRLSNAKLKVEATALTFDIFLSPPPVFSTIMILYEADPATRKVYGPPFLFASR